MTRSSCCAGQLLDDWWSGFYKAVFEAKHKYKGKETTSSSAILPEAERRRRWWL